VVPRPIRGMRGYPERRTLPGAGSCHTRHRSRFRSSPVHEVARHLRVVNALPRSDHRGLDNRLHGCTFWGVLIRGGSTRIVRSSLRLLSVSVLCISILTVLGASVHPAYASAALPAPFSGAFIDNEPGALVPDDGQQTLFSSEEVTQGLPNDYNTLSFLMSDPDNSQLQYTVMFEAPNSGVLNPGTYENTQIPPYLTDGAPGLEVVDDGSVCDEVGQFTVLDASYTSPDVASSFAATFEVHCGTGGPGVFGDISFNSTAPFYADSLSGNSIEIDSAGEDIGVNELTVTNT